MAKITANGATEVAKVRTRGINGTTHLWVINSKGVVLHRSTGNLSTGYTVYGRKYRPTRDALLAVIQRVGHTVI